MGQKDLQSRIRQLGRDGRFPPPGRCPNRLDFAGLLADNALVEEDSSVQRLILRRCRHLPLDSQMGQELFDLGASHTAGVPELMEPDECCDPSYISLSGPVGVVQRSDLRSALIQQFHASIARSAMRER